MWIVRLFKPKKATYRYRRAEIAKQQYDFWVEVYGKENVEMEYQGSG